jgi:hypothetical protein
MSRNKKETKMPRFKNTSVKSGFPTSNFDFVPALSIYDKMNNGHYKPKLPYPSKSDFAIEEVVETKSFGTKTFHGTDEAAFKAAIAAYRAEDNALHDEFKADAFAEAGITGNPKAEKCWDLAWEHGHASGYSDVLNYLVEFSELIK